MAEPDEVIRELDVFVCDTLELYLLQLPLKPCYSDAPEINHARFKPKHRRLEVEGDETVPKLLSSPFPKSSNLGVGIIKDNALHITPLKDVMQLRPSFDGLRKDMETVEIMSDDDEDDTKSKQPALEQVQIKRKETERSQSARLQSYSHLKASEESEPWQRLRVHLIGSDASDSTFSAMYLRAEHQSISCFSDSS